MKIVDEKLNESPLWRDHQAKLNLKILDNVWKFLTPYLKEKFDDNGWLYREINKGIIDAIDESGREVLITEYRISNEMLRFIKSSKEMEDYVKHNLATKLADDLLSSDLLVVERLKDPYRCETRYILAVPMFVLKEKESRRK